MLLALQSLDASARAGVPALLEAEEALHWALQAAHVPYPGTERPVEVRIGPNGPTGVFRLPLDDLVALARPLGERGLTGGVLRYDIDRAPRRRRLGLAGRTRGGTARLPPQAGPAGRNPISIVGNSPAEAWQANSTFQDRDRHRGP